MHHEVSVGVTLFLIAIVLVVAKLSAFLERFGQPPVLGELLAGVLLGNLYLAGITFFEPIKENQIIQFMSELGVVILLFQVGLETNIRDMARVGIRAFLVASVGVIAPFILGTYVVGPWLMPGLESHTYLFLGATLTATSVGITARVFRDLGFLQSQEARIVLGAAVIDDVMGLVILAVVSAIVTVGSVSPLDVGVIIFKALAFLTGAVLLGQVAASWLGRMLAKIHTGSGMKFTLAIAFGFIFAYIAELIGLAPIVGAFAAGLVLDAVHFESFENPRVVAEIYHEIKEHNLQNVSQIEKIMKRHAHRHVEDIIEPVGMLLTPIFFVITGMSVQITALLNPSVLMVALGFTIAAFVGKVIAGLVAGKVNKQIVGWGMVPRGEVGLIFAATGRALGVINDEIFSVIVVMVLLSTLLTPLILTAIIRRNQAVQVAAQ
ncbi:Sodium/hydrogen exchanger [Oscillochloris trichoides DG-6]|uniref:Sodium/hydrogen exchanger n=1 Tax=Oscillochloris trichoides DG-6 TaxID=765420 RepID=E1IAB5_9CHLR|nr:cation:proton antiporter [Oscillochloris trichoides]EFO81869.1 Sodium/hydrogen exchanger [Oscillochloris trichoides DG-6]